MDIMDILGEYYMSGYCTHCEEVTCDSGVEPDAEGYSCPQCDNDTVMGVENAIISGEFVPPELDG